MQSNAVNSKISIGVQALQLLDELNFQKEWDHLFEICPWATIYQSRNFVSSWYEIHQNGYLPIIIRYYKNEKLQGLVTLSKNISVSGIDRYTTKGNKIICAGNFEAEYQVWLSFPSENNEFLNVVQKNLFQLFPNSYIIFRYIPSKLLLTDNFTNIFGKYAVIQSFHRPFINFKSPNYYTSINKRHFRAKYNRLKNAGNLEILQILDPLKLDSVYDDIMVDLDFRHGSTFNKKPPSLRYPDKKDFFISLLKQGLLHATLLKLDGEVISSVIGVMDKNCMHLSGMISYSPFYSKYSPGVVHLYLLSKMLVEQGIEEFDLTPGDDGYKERHATHGDKVFKVIISRSPRFRTKNIIKRNIDYFLLLSGIRPKSFFLNIQKSLQSFQSFYKRISFPRFLNPNFVDLRNTNINELSEIILKQYPGLIFEKNSLRALLAYKERGAYITRWQFLEDAKQKIEKGLNFYTWSNQNELIACIWFENRSNENLEKKMVCHYMDLKELFIHPDYNLFNKNSNIRKIESKV